MVHACRLPKLSKNIPKSKKIDIEKMWLEFYLNVVGLLNIGHAHTNTHTQSSLKPWLHTQHAMYNTTCRLPIAGQQETSPSQMHYLSICLGTNPFSPRQS